MSAVIRNVLAVLGGAVLGGAVNMAIVVLGPQLIPVPAGVDVTDADSIGASMHLFQPRHFIAPFAAHALGTLSGSLFAFLVAASYKDALAYAIGALFLAGGVSAVFMIPAPAWFIVADLLLAYIPMAWIATQLGRKVQRS